MLPISRRPAPTRARGSPNASSWCSCSRPTVAHGPAPTARAARSSRAATNSPREAGPHMKKRLLPDIVSITPSNYDDFAQCERRFLNRHLLGLPASDPGAANETGLLVHDMLRVIHDRG